MNKLFYHLLAKKQPNRISVTEEPLLKTKDSQIEVGEQEPPIILLADMAFIFLQ